MKIAVPTDALEYTGERMVPEKADSRTFWEHIYRYRFACKFVRGRRVLDIACGEGYGAHALLRAGATSVIGVDICEDTCLHARKKYGVDARVGNAESISLPDRSVDVVVSFETIEHVYRPSLFLEECARVLVPGGVLIVSTPNRPVYGTGRTNPFHCSEMDEAEFTSCLKDHFERVELYGQTPAASPWWTPACWWRFGPAWNRVRGVWSVKRYLCPHLFSSAGASYRLAPVEAILRRDSLTAAWVNPFGVRRHFRWMAPHPTYLIAVARRPASA